jgi:DNA-binding MarR family transcriptional regulator
MATVNLIKERLIDRMPNTSRLLNKLLEKGLVKKERNLNDQRVVYVKLTPEGSRLKEQARQIIDDLQISLDKDQANQLNDLLEQIRK